MLYTKHLILSHEDSWRGLQQELVFDSEATKHKIWCLYLPGLYLSSILYLWEVLFTKVSHTDLWMDVKSDV